jgi:hypothetical protein
MLFQTYNLSFIYLIAQANRSGGAGGFLGFIIGIAAYIFASYCFYKIYQKLGEPNAWFAWIPILNNWIMYKAGDQSPW